MEVDGVFQEVSRGRPGAGEGGLGPSLIWTASYSPVETERDGDPWMSRLRDLHGRRLVGSGPGYHHHHSYDEVAAPIG